MVGSAWFSKDIGTAFNAKMLNFNFNASAQTNKSLHDTKDDADYLVDSGQKFKMMSVMIKCSASQAIIISESSTTDFAGSSKFSCLTPGAGQWTYPIDQVKFNSQKYVVADCGVGNAVYSVSVAGHQTTTL